ncbi:MAG: SDR family NAD(P)-dependent oxidoreductase [Solirubrobacterales bacterium]
MAGGSAGTLLLFGGTGVIAGAIRDLFKSQGWRVVSTARRPPEGAGDDWVAFDPFAEGFDHACLDGRGPFSAVVWAQGANRNDSVYDLDVDAHLDLYRANVLFNLVSLKLMLDRGLLAPASRLCVISSIWQNLARQKKLSYCVTKSALQGFVLSASADLAEDGHVINAILPGALDTPMTRANLQPAQIAAIAGATKFGRLPQLDDVANLALFLCGPGNTGITGQFIAADLGFSHVRIV